MVKDLEDLFSDEERQRIDAAVAEAERGTAAEIVVVVTDTSGAYDRPEDLFGFALALAVLAALWVAFQGVDPAAAWSTSGSPALVLGLPQVLAVLLGAFLVGVVVASRSWAIRHLFTPAREMQDCLERGAERAFFLQGIGRTQGATGVLIYVSLFERMVHVVGDEAVRTKLGAGDFEGVRDAILDGFRSGKPAVGLLEGIRLAGERLAAHFPAAADDQDELPNHLVLFRQGL